MKKMSFATLLLLVVHQSVMSMSPRLHLLSSLVVGCGNIYVLENALENQIKFDACNSQYKEIVAQKKRDGLLGFRMHDMHQELDRSFSPFSQHLAAVTSCGLLVISSAPTVALSAACMGYGLHGVYKESKMLDAVAAAYTSQAKE